MGSKPLSQSFVILALLGLAAAFQRGDRDQLAHEARRAGHRLSGALASDDRTLRLAAVAAAPEARSPWVTLAPLAKLARSIDRREAASAAWTAARIAGDLDRRTVLDQDFPVDLLHERMAAWRAVARDRGRWPDVRVHALETAAAVHRALGSDAVEAPFDLATTALDPEPEVRRAAFELLPAPLPDELIPMVAGRVTGDGESAVALAAAQALCLGIALDADPAPLLAALGDAGLARITELTVVSGMSAAAVTDARRCLDAAGAR